MVCYPTLTLPYCTLYLTLSLFVLVSSRRQHHAAHSFNFHSAHVVSPPFEQRNPSKAPNDASVRAHNRLTDMEHLKVAFSNTGGEPYHTAWRTRRTEQAGGFIRPTPSPNPTPPTKSENANRALVLSVKG